MAHPEINSVNETKMGHQDRPSTDSAEGFVIRSRAIWIGLILSLLICAVTPFNNVYRKGTLLGGGHFPLAPFFILLVFTVLIIGLGRLSGRKPFMNGKELLTAWIMTVLASGIAYTGLVRTLFVNLTAPFHFATVGNRWDEVLFPLLPRSWYPQNPEAIESLYNGLEGGRNLGWLEIIGQIPWQAWLGPLMVWTGFILLCYLVMICLVNLLSRQWIKNERMNFPLLQVPMLMEEAVDRGALAGFFLNRFLLVGLMIPVILHLFNGLNLYLPSVPNIPTLVLAGAYFPKYGLFSGFYKLKLYIYPAFIGFAFLTSRQISFSFWFLFFMGGLLLGLLSVLGYNIPASALGVTFGPHLTRPEETQIIGAFLVFFAFIIWLARNHLTLVLKQAFGLQRTDRSDTEWFSLRVTFWVAALGLMAIIAWLNYYGLPLSASILVVFAFFAVMLVASRVVCQGGIAYFSLSAAPIDGLVSLVGPGFFTNVGLLVAAVVQKVLFLDLRESLMPSLFHKNKIDQQLVNKKMLIFGIGLTLILAVVVSYLAMLSLCYKYGMRELELDWATRTSLSVLENVQNLIESPVRSGPWVKIFILIGGLIMLVLVICYHRFYWWPIHPIGYLTAYSSGMDVLWFSFFAGWLFNALSMRYGGIALFNRLRFFFIGLIIGDIMMGGSFAIIGLFSDVSYQVLPN